MRMDGSKLSTIDTHIRKYIIIYGSMLMGGALLEREV